MTIYKLFLNGENFWLKFEGNPSRLGFYTTRFVEANSPDEAVQIALSLIRNDPKLEGVLNDRNDPPMIYVEEIEIVETDDGEIPQQPGFGWYSDTDNESG